MFALGIYCVVLRDHKTTDFETYLTKRFPGKEQDIVRSLSDLKEKVSAVEQLLSVNEILEETVDLLKKDETRYKGPVIHETFEELVIRSKYGDVVVQKKEIREWFFNR